MLDLEFAIVGNSVLQTRSGDARSPDDGFVSILKERQTCRLSHAINLIERHADHPEEPDNLG